MEPHSQTDDTPGSRSILEGQLRECYGRLVYTHKTHEKCADILIKRFARIKFWQIVLSALTTAGFLGVVFGVGGAAAIVGVCLSTTLLAINSFTKKYDLGEIAQKHKRTASDLWLIREKYLSLLVDLRMKEKPLETLQEKRDELAEALHRIYASAPTTTDTGYKKAQVALQQLEDMTFSDREIDAFLPNELRRGNSTQPDDPPKTQ